MTDFEQALLPKEDTHSMPTLEDKEVSKEEKLTDSAQQDESDYEKELADKTFKDYIPIIICCCMVAFGGFVFGFDTGTIGGFVNMTDFKERFGSVHPDGEHYFSNVRSGLMIGIFNVGCGVGSIVLLKLGDMYGRRVGILIAMVIYIVGLIIQIASQYAWYQFMIGRIITGLAVGTLSVLCPLLISECSPKKIRGMLVCCFQLMITFGIFLGYCVVYATHKYDDSRQWRIPVGLCFAWALFMIGGMYNIPESPRYLVDTGKIEKAKESIAKSNGVSPELNFVYRELELIQAGNEREHVDGSSNLWKEVFTGQPRLGYRLFVGTMLQSLQQLTGDNYFFYYATTIFKAVNIDNFTCLIIIGTINFASTFLNIYVVDRFGRRNVLLTGSVGMAICMLVYATVGSQHLFITGQSGPTRKPDGDGLIFVTALYVFFFALTWAGGCYAVVSELYPLRIRAKAMSVPTASNWMWGFLIAFFTPFIDLAIRFYFGYVFFGCLLFSIPFVYFCVSETKGLSLEEVDLMYAEGVLAFKSLKWTPPSAREQIKIHDA